ncbi:hypothetical protein P170DRAFT_425812 [Aspergillus steynii IBT 23096]|uniref:Uncharacterized protein n=1 Tax=Aspergillus steynii IBT 23096 TaxID=1392250 RepID=A0A2I2G7E4_9EURO|nr:uncharacterized protein P170DRAFT_425812 [Aspergillus steynii IBT 23096]PLB48802.1 hypothetical protein P170DRAFT_425812 [Aspergillus steynii IBT 23096]
MRWPRRRKSKAPEQPAQQSLPSPAENENKPTAENKSPIPPPVQENEFESIPPQTAYPVQPTPAQPPPAEGLVLSPPIGYAPLGSDATENEEITIIWWQVQERVRLLAEREGKEINVGLEINDVIANLESSQEKEEESPTKEAVKVAFGRTMGLIKTVGGIVVDGASTVFAPAGQCYNVISFLINAYDGYQGAFDGLAELLEKCSDHLGRLDYYVEGGMDKRLSRLAAQQLLLFVQICDTALSLQHSAREKIKTGLKIAFLAENSIQGLLGEMAKLAERERGLVSAQTFQLASAAATSAAEGAASNKQVLDALAQNGAEQKARVDNQGKQRTLMDVLAFDKDSDRWDWSKGAPVEIWQKRYNDIRKDVVSGTGKWLLSRPVFQSWISDFASSSILAVEGTDITGKSYLTSSVVKYVRTDVITQYPDFRHLVAFFFIDRNKPGHGFDAMAKSLIWQLADKDEPYMKSAARISQSVGALDPDDILPKLLLENPEIEHMDAVFYLIIDGLGDNLDASFLKFLQRLGQSRNKRIRVFLTGMPRAFEQMIKAGVACRSIPISQNNGDDITKFIEARMNKFDALADTDRPGVLERRNQIREQLSQAAAGDYYKLDSALNVISTLDYMEDIHRVIQGTRDDRSKQLHDEIEMLNRERSVRQIQEINQIILWVTFSLGPISERIVSAALYMVTGEVPLRPLAEQIRTKYLLFEVDRKGCVGFRSSKALDVIPHRNKLAKSNEKIAQEIHPGEIDIVLHFLDNVCPPALYQKLEIREYLQKKLTQKQVQIQQEDKDTGNLRLALDCLRSLTHGHDAGLTLLQEYAQMNLIDHLSSVDLAMVDRDQKSQVGESLIRLFTRNECIETLMWPELGDPYFRTKKDDWVDDSENVDQVVRWLRDTAVVASVTDESDQSWIHSVVSGNAFEALLKPSAVRLAHRCLREAMSAEDAEDLYRFVNQFLYKISRKPGEDEDEDEDDAVCISRFEQWAHGALQLADKDTLWHTQMAMIFKQKGLDKEVIERCELALQLDSSNWRASLCRAKVAPISEAVAILQTVLSRQERDLEWMQDPAHMEGLADLNYELATKYWDDEQFDLAIPLFTTSLKQAPRRVDRAADLLYQYHREERFVDMVSFIEQFAAIDDGKHLGHMVAKYTSWLSMIRNHQVFWDAAKATKKFGILDAIYQAAIKSGATLNNHEALFGAHFMYGRSLHDQPNRREDEVIRVWETAMWDYFPSSGLSPRIFFVDHIYGGLGPIYLKRTLTAKANSDLGSVKKYLSKLSNMVPEGVTLSQLGLPPNLWVARYHHLDGNEAKARQTVRTLVQVALELLSDEDETNDLDAYKKLRFIFVSLSDERNALTALAMEARESRFRNVSDREYSMRMPCGGQCWHFWDLPSEMWICKDCINVCLEINCVTKLKERTLEQNVCSPDHDFIQVPKWNADWLNVVPKGMVPWGEQNITLDQWKQKIRQAYIDVDA